MAYKTAVEDAELYTFAPSVEAERIVSEICNAVGLSQNFDIRASNVDNAMAGVDGERRVILYSNLFLKKFNEDACTRWAAYYVLAHEIGHHLNYHNFAEQHPGKRKLMELEADHFSGSALRLLGASLNESKAGIESFALEGEQTRHPSAKARLESLTAGWTQQQERLEKMGAGLLTPDATNSATCVSVVTVEPMSGPQDFQSDARVYGQSSFPFLIFPNPTSSDISVLFEMTSEQSALVRIYDLQGRLVLSHSFTAVQGENLLPLHLDNFASGVYLVDFQSADLKVMTRLVVQE